MDAVTVNHATQNLNHLIGQVISNVEPTIICNDKGERALLMSLDEFNSWQSCRVGNVLLLPTYSLSLEIKKLCIFSKSVGQLAQTCQVFSNLEKIPLN